MNYVLGIDGGGTKATAVVMDDARGVCEWFSGEGGKCKQRVSSGGGGTAFADKYAGSAAVPK